jgi:predicted transcriptional regulator
MSSYSLNLPNELLEEIQQVAQASQLSMDQWVLNAIAQKLESEKTQQLFQRYAQQADFERFDQILARVPDVEPIPGDELI